MAFGVDELAAGVRRLGVREGHTVLVRAALKAIGPVEGGAARGLIEAVLSVIGPTGTMVGLAFTPAYPRGNRNPAHVWRPGTPSATGGLASAMMNWPKAFGSRHPTNGFIAIGARAEELLADHDHTKPCFHPMNRIVEWGGQMVLVGCVSSSPGFSTVHLAQEHLGLSTQTIRPGLFGSYFENDGKIEWFARIDEPGCSMGFSKFYADYVREGELRVGDVGDAYSLGIDAAAAYEIELRKLERDHRAALCDRPDCYGCRGIWRYNKRDWPRYWGREYGRRLLSRLRLG